MEQVIIRKMPAPISTVFDIDDGATAYDRLVQETRRLLFGTTDDTGASNNLAQFRVLQGFVNRVPKDNATTAFKKTNSSSLHSCSFVEQGNKKKPILLKFVLNRKPPEEGNFMVNPLPKDCASAAFLKDNMATCLRPCGVLKRKSEATHDDPQKKLSKKIRSNCDGCQILNLRKKSENNHTFQNTDLNISQEQPDPLSSKMEKFIQEKRGTDIRLMIRKSVKMSDLNQQQSRLSIPPKQLKDEDLTFLTEQERSVLAIVNNPLPVMLMEPCGVESSLYLVKWSLNSTYSFVLRTGWNDVLQRNYYDVEEKEFKLGDVIQLWSFRDVDGKLWFAIDKVRDGTIVLNSEF